MFVTQSNKIVAYVLNDVLALDALGFENSPHVLKENNLWLEFANIVKAGLVESAS